MSVILGLNAHHPDAAACLRALRTDGRAIWATSLEQARARADVRRRSRA